MSDQPKWMPSDEEIDWACMADQSGGFFPLQAIDALIRAAVEKALAEPRPEATLNQRLFDLVRYQRHELHDTGLLTDDEFASLVLSGSSSARRLEDYDRLRTELAEQEALHKREVIEARIEELYEYGDCVCPVYGFDHLSGSHDGCDLCNRLRDLRAELAALDKEVKP